MLNFIGLSGVGLGLRTELLDDILEYPSNENIQFLEIAPENWMGMGGNREQVFERLIKKFPIVAHGLSLSLGGPAPLNKKFLADIRVFLEDYKVELYTEHLAYCADTSGYWYDLLPIPATLDTARYVADRIKTVQDILGKRIAIENASTYILPQGTTLPEWEFVAAISELADCALHIDINNVFVNSVNHNFDPQQYLRALDVKRVCYMHMAGHLEDIAPDTGDRLLIDTHGAPVCESVWSLYEFAVSRFGSVPTLLERDLNIPEFSELMPELKRIASIQAADKHITIDADKEKLFQPSILLETENRSRKISDDKKLGYR
ncbi:MAG: DUF692 domain-containing protein [Pseudomonadota bacterium]